MKKFLVFAFLIIGVKAAFAGDDLASRTDLYGSIPAQWRYSNFTSTTQVKATSGVVHTISINKATNRAFIVYDSSNTCGGTQFAAFASTAPIQTFFYDAIFNNGLRICSPASGPNVTVTYR
jgi:hypothetical protein